MSPLQNGRLGIGSIEASNLAMLSQWRWRFRSEPNALRCTVIKSSNGNYGGLSTNSNNNSKGPWKAIAGLKNTLDSLNIRNQNLKEYYGRLFALETRLN